MDRILAAGFILLLVYLVHSTSPVITSTDSMWSIYTAKSILQERDLDLDEYRATIKAKRKFGVRIKGSHYYNYFPPGPALVALPFVWVFETFPHISIKYVPGFERHAKSFAKTGHLPSAEDAHLELERAVASFCVALAAVLIFFAVTVNFPLGWALTLALVFAFSTSSWSVASRGLWQHAPSMLFLSAALWLAIKSERYPSLLAWTALPLAAAYLTRPTNVLSLLGFLLFITYKQPKRIIWYLLITLLVLLPFFMWSFETYHKLLPPYYKSGRLTLHEDFFEALLAQLFSPSRGLFVFSPVLLFTIYVLSHRIITKTLTQVEWLLCIICFLHWIAVASFPIWWGGHTYGPRLMSDLLPYLILLLAPLSEIISKTPALLRNMLVFLFALNVLLGVAIHRRGAYSYAPQLWNVRPANIDSYPERVWSIQDGQLFR